MQEYKFIIVSRYRNKREKTEVREKAVIESGVTDAIFSHKDMGVLSTFFTRSSEDAEIAVRSAADQLMTAMPDCVLFEIHSRTVERMAIRRAMMGFPLPWRFLDQGLPELNHGGLVIKTA